jgi:hypothetical protein
MRSRLIATIAIALMIVPGLQPVLLAGAQDITPLAQPAAPAGVEQSSQPTAPAGVAQSAQPTAPSPAGSTVSGSALRTDFKPLPAATARLRQFDGNGAVLASATTGPSGEFAFSGVPAGNYLIELLDFSGKLVGMAPPFVVAGQGPVVVSVMASGLGVTAASAAGGGFSLFGLGPTASLAVLGAAGAARGDGGVATHRTQPSGSGEAGLRRPKPLPGILRSNCSTAFGTKPASMSDGSWTTFVRISSSAANTRSSAFASAASCRSNR